jgi:hypothetical protein
MSQQSRNEVREMILNAKDRAPAFQFYPRQFVGDEQVMGMDLDAVGAHILLMCYAASSPERCRIPCRNDADEYAICMRLRNPSEDTWLRIKSQLLRGAWKVSADGQWWEQDGLRRTVEKQRSFSEEQQKRANKRWSKNDAGIMPQSCRTDAESVPKVCSSSSISSSIRKEEPFDPSFDGSEAFKHSVSLYPAERREHGHATQCLYLGAIGDIRKPGESDADAVRRLDDAVRAYAAKNGKFAVSFSKFLREKLYRNELAAAKPVSVIDPAVEQARLEALENQLKAEGIKRRAEKRQRLVTNV